MTFEKERKAPVRRGKAISYSISDPCNKKPENETKQDDIYLLGGVEEELKLNKLTCIREREKIC